MKKKIIISILALSVLLNLGLGVNLYSKTKQKNISKITIDQLSKSDKENLISDLYSVKGINENDKKNTAKRLFEEYINKNLTDWQTVQSKHLNRKPLPTFTDYRINDVVFVKESGNKFTVDISYDIQYTEAGTQWVAGDGELSDNNWVLKKGFLVDLVKYEDKYLIVDVYH